MSNKPPQDAESILRLIEQTRYEYSDAVKNLRKLEKLKMLVEMQTTVIINSKHPELLKNEDLKAKISGLFDDPKFKPTVDFIASCVYLENQAVMEDYNYYLKLSKQAEKEFEMLSSQLIWHQSQAKIKGIELMNKV